MGRDGEGYDYDDDHVFDYMDDDDWDEEAMKCPTCSGTGIATPLSPHLPKHALVLGVTECPRCAGVGEF